MLLGTLVTRPLSALAPSPFLLGLSAFTSLLYDVTPYWFPVITSLGRQTDEGDSSQWKLFVSDVCYPVLIKLNVLFGLLDQDRWVYIIKQDSPFIYTISDIVAATGSVSIHHGYRYFLGKQISHGSISCGDCNIHTISLTDTTMFCFQRYGSASLTNQIRLSTTFHLGSKVQIQKGENVQRGRLLGPQGTLCCTETLSQVCVYIASDRLNTGIVGIVFSSLA